MKLESYFLIANFIVFILLFGFFVIDGVSVEVYEYTEDSQVPWFDFEVVKDSDKVKGAYSAYGNLSAVNDTQVCKENPKCTIVD